MNSIFDNLNKKQIEAVKTVDGPVMAVAGAGSGKTRVLTNRIAYLIGEIGIVPSNILAITFTNKAAEEMRSRVFNLIDLPVSGIWISTFHAMGAKILRYDIHHLGYDNDFQIIDDEDSNIITKTLLKKHNFDLKQFYPKVISKLIANVKGSQTKIEFLEEPIRSVISQIYNEYNDFLKDNNLVDFQDLLILPLRLFKNHPDVLHKYQNMFRYILVDEFQDTNDLQYDIVKLLALDHHNLFIVGDEDQSIYAFRGSNIQNIKKFMRDFPEYKKVILDQNYRSRDNILQAANSVIKNNKSRIPKDLFSTLGPGEKIIHYKAGSDEEEAYFVYDKIRQLIKMGYNKSDIAILYRNNSMSRRFEDIFLKHDIAHKVIGNISFYKRKEIKDIIAYLHLIVNKGDDYSFSRVCNVPKRGIGGVTYGKLEGFARDHNLKIMDLISEDMPFVSKKTKAALVKFKNTIIDLQNKIEDRNLLDTYDVLLEQSGYKAMLENNDLVGEKAFEAERRLDNINEFKTIILEKIKDYDNNFSNYEILTIMLNDLALREEAEDAMVDNDFISLMTIHSAKGLEFKAVFLTCLEQTLFPSSQALQERNNVEEERRLFYVALTRAKDLVFLTNCKSRFMYGHYMENLDSQFLDEIDEELIERRGMYRPKNIKIEKPYHRKPKPIPKTNYEYEKTTKSIHLGDKVEHKKFGLGVVVNVKEDKVTVAFKSPTGIKILLKDHPSYKVLE
ncbi:ATP-dependent helicase [Candidatus Izemoplasma sp. B36]|uniref:ATP-dependent helicase n=1 Tax=Candidatus Izemoplasma sp. B36 TaxID=3242468 RepID=UPI003555DA50